MKLFFRKYGNGPPLIILHGLYGSSDNWVTTAKNIGNYFTVYLPDQRNHGQSPHSNTHNYNAMRDDLQELAEDLNLDKFFLAGHSMGGKTAISYALKWPDKLHGLLIADISPFISEADSQTSMDTHFAILTTILDTDLSGVSSRNEAGLLLSQGIKPEKIQGFIMKNLHRKPDNTFTWKLNAHSLFNNLDKIMEGILHRGVSDNQITGFPVIFLKGKNSDYLPESDFSDILRIFPAAEFIEVPDAGHWIHADQPDEVQKNLIRLLRDS
ncbi:MAG TPA: alpha/beta fold hydrolase [Bacteroidales bacterium]|nr:alpha/beta fold hydrolase [Bacteroidales bacterium]